MKITPELILELMKVKDGGIQIDDRLLTCDRDRIPESAKALRCGIDESGAVQVIFEDESFGEVFEGNPIPLMSPRYNLNSPVIPAEPPATRRSTA